MVRFQDKWRLVNISDKWETKVTIFRKSNNHTSQIYLSSINHLYHLGFHIDTTYSLTKDGKRERNINLLTEEPFRSNERMVRS